MSARHRHVDTSRPRRDRKLFVRIPDAMLTRIDEAAAARGRNRSEHVRELLLEGLK